MVHTLSRIRARECRGKRERADCANDNRRADCARRTGVLQVVSAIASLKKVVDFEHACGGTIGLQGNRFPRLR
jgi:hypothetical protein